MAGQVDHLLDGFDGGDGLVVVADEGGFEHLHEGAALDDVALGAGLYLIVEHLFEHLEGDVLVLKILDFEEEVLGEDGDVALLEAGGGVNVDDLAAGEGLVDDLADGGFHLGVAAAAAGDVELGEAGLDGLEVGNLVALIKGVRVGDGDGEGLIEEAHLVEEAVFAAGETEDVVFGLKDHAEFGLDVGGEVGLVVEAVEHALDDVQLLKEDLHGLLLLGGGVALAARLGVEAEGFLEVGGDAEVVDDEAGGLVLINPVDAGDGLHQVVALHGLIYI